VAEPFFVLEPQNAGGRDAAEGEALNDGSLFSFWSLKTPAVGTLLKVKH
jgi:hypothetical protein